MHLRLLGSYCERIFKKGGYLMFFPALVGLLGLVGVVVFFWLHNGPGSGRPFGNRVAATSAFRKVSFTRCWKTASKARRVNCWHLFSVRNWAWRRRASSSALRWAGGLRAWNGDLAPRTVTTGPSPLLPDLSRQPKSSDIATPTPSAGRAHPSRHGQHRLTLRRGKHKTTHVLIACSACFTRVSNKNSIELLVK